MTNPKTAAFAKAGQAISEEKTTAFLSDSDVEDDKDEDLAQPESTRARLVIEEEEEEEEEEDAMEIAKEEEVFVVSSISNLVSYYGKVLNISMSRMSSTLWSLHEETQCLLLPETPSLAPLDLPHHLLETTQQER